MTSFSAFWFLLIAVLAVFPTILMRKWQRVIWWDYSYPFLGVFLWFPLAIAKVGSVATLSNFVVELFWIAVVSISIPWIRYIISRFQKQQIKVVSSILTFLPIIAAIVIRLTMPTLPE